MASEHRIERKLAAILVADMVGYSRLAGADEDRILARLRALRSDLIDPTFAVHHGRIVKRTGDGIIVEFRSVVDAVRCAIEMQNGMLERNAGLPAERRIEFRVGIHLGDVVEETDGDLMGDGVNIAARLEGIAEPGGICLSHAAYEQVRDKLKEHFVDLGDKELKNIARPMRVYAITLGPESAALPASASGQSKQRTPHLSIVVLPFTNLSGDPEQEYFVDGVTESLTTDLSRINGFFVIGRNTAFTYKGKPFDVRRIGHELNVRYVLEGSVQRSGIRMRVNVQLIDAETGNHIWAERFDKPVADLFDMQDEIVARLGHPVFSHIISAEARRAERTPRPDSMDLCFQARAWWYKGFTPDNLAAARLLYERSLALDPDNVWGLVGIATLDVIVAASFLPDDRAARLVNAEAAVTKALSLAPEHASAHMCMGMVQIHTNRLAEGVRETERALELSPSLANAHSQIGYAKLLLDKADDTEAHVEEALRLSPHDPFVYLWCALAGAAKFYLGNEEEAVTWLRRSIESNRNHPRSHFLLAAALARLGRLPEARSEVQVGLAVDPTFTIARIRGHALSDIASLVSGQERLVDGLRQAGLPEQ
jgi:TolB-like protein/class 3 adenylate cyclase